MSYAKNSQLREMVICDQEGENSEEDTYKKNQPQNIHFQLLHLRNQRTSPQCGIRALLEGILADSIF